MPQRVHVFQDVVDGTRVAHKKIPKTLPRAVRAYLRELACLQCLSGCRNVVPLVANAVSPDAYHLYTLWCNEGTVPYKRLQFYDIRMYMREISSGLHQIHSRGIVHGDIKHDNVVVGDINGRRTAVIIDFEDARFMADPEEKSTFLGQIVNDVRGSTHYMAPELLRSERGPSNDVWGMGIIAYVMATGRLPFSGKTINAVWKSTLCDEPDLSPIPDKDCRDFVRLCLQKDPQERPSSQTLCQHPFVL